MPQVVEWMGAGPRTATIAPADLTITDAAVARMLGFGARSSSPPNHVLRALAQLRPMADALLEAQVLWAPFAVDVKADALICRMERPARLDVGNIVAHQLRGSSALVVFVATIGGALEGEARRMMISGAPLDGYMLDAFGSVAVDACAAAMAERVESEVSAFGWQTTNRFSPGYCTWPTEDQHALFAVLPPRPGGVTLMPSALMQPIKSISGVIGVGATAKYSPYPCEFCGMEDCRQRLVEPRLG